MSFEERLEKLKEIQQGWINYFRMASLSGKLKDLDSWMPAYRSATLYTYLFVNYPLDNAV